MLNIMEEFGFADKINSFKKFSMKSKFEKCSRDDINTTDAE